MNIAGERILIFGDSLTHPGQDGPPYIFNIQEGSNRQSSAPGDLLGSMLLEQGAAAVQLDARVGRSAYSFWNNEDSAALLQADSTFAPTKVIIILGTNDIGRDLNAEAAAFQQLRDAYKNMGAEVWAIGPFTYVAPNDGLNEGAQAVAQMMSSVFGSNFIDGRQLSVNAQRAGDGVHFQPISAAPTATNLLQAIDSASPLSLGRVALWAAIGLGTIIAFGWGAKFLDRYREKKALEGSNELEGLEGLTYDDFYTTGIQDCGNAFDAQEIDINKLAEAGEVREDEIKAAIEKFDNEELASYQTTWLEQQDEPAVDDIGSKEAFEAWREGYKACALRSTKRFVQNALERKREETVMYWLSADPIGRDFVEKFDTFEEAYTKLLKLPEGRIDEGNLDENIYEIVAKHDNNWIDWTGRWGAFTSHEQDELTESFPGLVPTERSIKNVDGAGYTRTLRPAKGVIEAVVEQQRQRGFEG